MEIRRIMGPMGRLGPMGLMGLMGIMSLMGLMGLMGCSEDHEEAEVRRQTVELKPCSPMFVEEQERSVTRGDDDTPVTTWTPPTGYYLYTHELINGKFIAQWDLTYKSIECFFTKDGEEPKRGTFFYNDKYENEAEKWRLSMEITGQSHFYVYGYIPSEVVDNASITDKSGTNANYSTGAVLTLEGIDAVTPSDVCVVIGAKEGTSATEDNGLQAGKFLVTANQSTKTGEGDGDNYIYLLFDHLYSALRFNYKVNKDYNDLRTIKLRNLKMKPYTDDSQPAYKAKYNATITLTDGVSTPSVVLEPNDDYGDIEYVTIFDEELHHDTPVTLSTEPSEFLGCFVPGQTTRFMLRTTYDVYDKKGNLIRESCRAENFIDLKEKYNLTSVERGHIYALTLIVNPTYLYVLSDPDVDNPTITIN